MTKDNIIYVGNKMFMNYVTSVLMLFNKGAPEVRIKARGKQISRAVDVAEMVRNKFLKDAKIKNIEIFSEEFEDKEGKMRMISAIDLTLVK